MRSDGCSTSVIFSAENFAGMDDVYRNSGFEHYYGPDEPAYKGEKRYVFKSVADGVLLSHAADLISGFDHEGRLHLACFVLYAGMSVMCEMKVPAAEPIKTLPVI